MARDPATGQSVVANALIRSALFGNQPRGRFPVVSPLQNIGRFAQALAGDKLNRNAEEERLERNKAFGQALRDFGGSDISEERAELLADNPDLAHAVAPDLIRSIFSAKKPTTSKRFVQGEEAAPFGSQSGFVELDALGNAIGFTEAAELDEDPDDVDAKGVNAILRETVTPEQQRALGAEPGDRVRVFENPDGTAFATTQDGSRIQLGSRQYAAIGLSEQATAGATALAPGKAQVKKVRERSDTSAAMIGTGAATLKDLLAFPKAGTGPGLAITEAAGQAAAFADVVGLGGLARRGVDIVAKGLVGLPENEVARIATEARQSVTNFISFIAQDTSRFSDQDLKFARQIIQTAQASGNPVAMVAAQQKLWEMAVVRDYQFSIRNQDSGIKPQYDIADPESMFKKFRRQGFDKEKAFEMSNNLNAQLPFFARTQPFNPREP